MRLAGPLLDPKAPAGAKASAFLRCALFYPLWYLRLWLPTGLWPRFAGAGDLGGHLRFVERGARRLARTLFHQMLRFGPRLERRQMILARLVDAGTELFAMSAACSKALSMEGRGEGGGEPRELADLFCRQARLRVAADFRGVCRNTDGADSRLARKVLDGGYAWMEAGILPDDGVGFQGPAAEEHGPAEERRRYPT
jgi:hypothetical protein